MNDNPLVPSPERDRKIRAKAEKLWIADGKPSGGVDAYIEQASEIVGMEEHPHAGEIPANDPHVTYYEGEPIENAEIQKNLGEFPERLTDQGDREHFPESEN